MQPPRRKLILCGPQITSIPAARLLELHAALSRHPKLWRSLIHVVDTLPTWYLQIARADDRLACVQSFEGLQSLREWMKSGRNDVSIDPSDNHASLPWTIVLQLSMYLEYLSNATGDIQLSELPTILREYGVQGFCAGFLTAAAIALSEDEDALASNAAVSLRLAMCIGLCIDADIASIKHESQVCVLSAYISCVTDDTCVTITVLSDDYDQLAQDLERKGIKAKKIGINGRFHSADLHSAAVGTLKELVATQPSLQYPNAKNLKAPLRSNYDGRLICDNASITEIAIDTILLHTADWYATVRKSVEPADGASRLELVPLSLDEPLVPLSILQRGGQINVLTPRTPNGLANRHIKPVTNGMTNGFTTDHAGINGHAEANESAYRIEDSDYPANSVAIVGMAGRFPGANDLDAFWELLKTGQSMVREPPKDRLDLHGDRLADRSGVKFWGNFIDDADAFDHRFFKKSPRESIAWDPGKRILLEVVYEALESAGHFGPSRNAGANDYGCFIGTVANNYYDNVACHPPNAYSMLGTSRAFFSGRISHQFGFTGPAMSIDTACSSSLVAISAACRAIQSGDCTRAVAGGTNIFTSPYDFQNLAAAGFLSPSGPCKPFDTSADGYCRGEGVAAVVLKSLSKALEEGDKILGVIVGSAVNQNHNDAHITVPCSRSQTTAYQTALRMGNASPSDVTYVEAHGTGTQVGDPIECQSIRQAFGSPNRSDKLYFGSVKGSIGHTEATAGVAGLIKVLLMMKHKTIPPQAGFTTLNPKIPTLEPDMMAVPTTCQPWSGTSRLACINSYGAAGSNAVIVLREAPESIPSTVESSLPVCVPHPLFISASSEGSLRAYAAKLLDRLRTLRKTTSNEQHLLSSFLFQLSRRGNHELSFFVARTVNSLDEVEHLLEATVIGTETTQQRGATSQARPLILVFGGQEQTSVGLTTDSLSSCAILRMHLERCAFEAEALGVADLISAVHQTTIIPHLPTLHAALFATQYATAKAWIDNGIAVNAVVGHSFGQMAALCVSGCLSLREAMRLVIGRAHIIESHWGPERGAMLSVQVERTDLETFVRNMQIQQPEIVLEIACYNHSRGHVLVGNGAAITAAEKTLATDPSLRVKRLPVTHGFHSMLSEPLLPALDRLANSLQWEPPHLHLELATEEAASRPPGPWLVSELTRKPVHFDAAIKRLSQVFESAVWLEAGSRSSIMSLVKQNRPSSDKERFFRSSLNAFKAVESIADTVLQLWDIGVPAQFWPYHQLQRGDYEHIDLPPYQFEKTRHWLPFIDRTKTEALAINPLGAIVEAKHEFISLLETTAEASTFLVDPESERYTYLLKGHMVAGQYLAPGSLYIELLSRATLLLTAGATDGTHVINIDWMKFQGSPIGLDSKKNIFIQLRQTTSGVDYWDYIISTRDKTGDPKAVVHATGRVGLKRRDDPYLKELTQRWSALIGYDRCMQLLASEETDKIQGSKQVYRALERLASFDEMYHGIKSISHRNHEAAGRVTATTPKRNPGPLAGDGSLYDTPTIDSLMQFAGVLVNHFVHPAGADVLVCQGINEIVTGGAFDLTAGEWVVYAVLTEDTADRTVADAYAFDPSTGQVVIAFMGFVFARVGLEVLNRSLHRANYGNVGRERRAEMIPTPPSSSSSSPPPPPPPPLSTSLGVVQRAATSPAAPRVPRASGVSSHRHELHQILHRVTDVPLDKILPEVTLEDLGIDSLLVTEVLREIQAGLGVAMDLDEFLLFPNVGAVGERIDEMLGTGGARAEMENAVLRAETIPAPLSQISNWVESGAETPGLRASEPRTEPALLHARKIFAMCKDAYSRAAVTTGAVGFWEMCYPDEAALIVAYVVEAFAWLGVDVAAIAESQVVAVVSHLERHTQLVRQLYHILEDAGLVTVNDVGQFMRTSRAVDPTPASELCERIIPAWPQHASVHRIVRAVGCELGPCLVGEKDGLQIVFGSKENKKTLDDLYENWPLVRAGTLALGEYLERLLQMPREGEVYRILEVGAGTGGTTKYIVAHLQRLGVPFEYVFTDLSASLVAAAKRTFQDCPEMRFSTLDVEREPEPSWVNSFHVIISTNCIHATRDLTVSLKSLRRMLRDDGVLTLVEITQNMFWLDIAVGLFEGWWLFEDGREHAVTHETRWKSCMEAAGFAAVDWTDGADQEAQTIRVIAGFASE